MPRARQTAQAKVEIAPEMLPTPIAEITPAPEPEYVQPAVVDNGEDTEPAEAQLAEVPAPVPTQEEPEAIPPNEPAEIDPAPAEAPAPVVPTAQDEPPCPPKGPAGDKDPDHMAWMAQYRPALFIQQYQTRGGEAVQKLLTKARACLNQ